MEAKSELIQIIENNIEIWGEGGCDIEGCATAILKDYVKKDKIEVDEIELANCILENSYHDTTEAGELAHAIAEKIKEIIK
jgi:hypothetical protein